MSWATPIIAGIATAIAVPTLLILYFLKLRRRDVEISTTMLWKKSIEDLQANAPFQRLRRNLLLFLQLLILAAALLAIAQPQFKSSAPVGQRHVIMIDRSASMSATDADDGRTRLDLAKEEADALVDSLREGGLFTKEKADEAMVIVFDANAEVRQQFTSDKAVLREAIDAIEPTDAPSSLAEAMRLARAHAPERIIEGQGLIQAPVGTIHIWSDGRIPDADQANPGPEDTVLYHAIGTANASNVAITSLRAERGYNDPSRLSVFAGLQGTSADLTTVSVSLLIDGAVAAVRDVSLAASSQSPGASGTITSGGVVFTVDHAQAATIAVQLDARDALRVDDTAWIAVPPAKRLSVAMVSPGNQFMTWVLEELPLARFDQFTPGEFQGVLDKGDAGVYDVVVYDRWLPGGEDGPMLPPGRSLVIGTVPLRPAGLSVVQGEGDDQFAAIMDWDRDHPVLRDVVLDNLVMKRLPKVELGESAPARVLASADRGPAMIELDTTDTRAIVIPFDVLESNWPFDISFVVTIASSLSYLGDDGSAGIGGMIRPGQTLKDRLPLDVEDAELATPDGKRLRLIPAADGSVVYGPVRHTGIYAIRWKGSDATEPDGARAVAVNLLDPNESDIRTADDIGLASRVVSASSSAQRRMIRKLWPWLILSAIAIMLLEWFVYNRKVYL